MHRRFIALAIAVAMWAGASIARAEEPMRVAVWIGGDTDEEVLSRVRGQVIDLDVELVVIRRERITGASERRIAGDVAAEADARIVVWFRAEADSLGVYIADLDGDRLLVRHIEREEPDDATELDRSAGYEAAALVVRSNLRALAAGGTIGVSAPPEPEPELEPEPEPEPEAAPTPLVETPAPSRGATVFAELGWNGAFTDADSAGHHALAGGLGFELGRWRLAAVGALGLGVDYADAQSRIRVARHAAAVRAEYVAVRGDRWELGAGLSAGAAAFSRTTLSVSGDAMATPPTTTLSPLVSPSARLRLRTASLPVVVELDVGADVLVSPPEFGYEIDGSFVERNRMWPAAPRAGLALVVEGG